MRKLAKGKFANVLSPFSLKGSPTGFRADNLNHRIVCRLPPQSAWWKVECCMLEHRGKYAVVRNVFALYEKAMCNIHPLCSQRSTPPRLLMLRRRPENPFRILADLQAQSLHRP